MPVQMSRVFGQPLTSPYEGDETINTIVDRAMADRPLRLRLDEQSGALQGNLGPLLDVAYVSGGIVKIVTQEGDYSSGFITTSGQGEQVIVTAGQGICEVNPRSLHLVDSCGNDTTAVNGRYILEVEGKMLEADYSDVPDVDMAILKPAKRIGRVSLKIGDIPKRGSWVELLNYQLDAPFNQPYHYSGIVLTDLDIADNLALVGVQPERRNESRFNYTAQHGVGGGPIFDPLTGEVVGMSFSDAPGPIADEGEVGALHIFFDTPFNGRTGLYPQLMHFQHPRFMREVLASL